MRRSIDQLAHDALQRRQSKDDLLKKRGIVVHENTAGMLRPEFAHALIEFPGLLERFI